MRNNLPRLLALALALVILTVCGCASKSGEQPDLKSSENITASYANPAEYSPPPTLKTTAEAPPESGNAITAAPEGTIEVHFIDVGQADCALVLCGGEAMLIDGGNAADSSLVAAYLKEHGVERLSYIIATHVHEDHTGGLSGALNVCAVDKVYCPVTEYDSDAFRSFLKYTAAQGLEITLPSPGDTFSLGVAVVQILGPQVEYEDTNNTSIVLRIDFGETSFLFTGDAERESELDILDAGCDLAATVLKVGHHGSGSSTSYPFLREIMPEYAVISVGVGNSYGHPGEDVLSRLRDADVTVYRTDMQGHIIAVSDGETVVFQTERNGDIVTNPTETTKTGAYIGNINSLKFHRETCSNLPAEHNRVYFESRSDAVAAGYSPCGLCNP